MSYTINEECNGCGACRKICPARAIEGEKKTVHAIIHELCIECGACGRVCPQGAVRDEKGNPCERVKRSEWKKPRTDMKTCTACGMCADACPVGCLVMSAEPRKGGVDPFPYLADEMACIGCGLCCTECRFDALSMK